MFSQEWKDHYDTKELKRILSDELEQIKDSWVSGEYSDPQSARVRWRSTTSCKISTRSLIDSMDSPEYR